MLGGHSGGSPVDDVTDRSGDLDTVGRNRGTHDITEKGDGRYKTGEMIFCFAP